MTAELLEEKGRRPISCGCKHHRVWLVQPCYVLHECPRHKLVETVILSPGLLLSMNETIKAKALFDAIFDGPELVLDKLLNNPLAQAIADRVAKGAP